MKTLVEFVCPKHGVVLETVPSARVEHFCGEECSPEGVPVKEHLKRVQATLRKRDNRRKKALVSGV